MAPKRKTKTTEEIVIEEPKTETIIPSESPEIEETTPEVILPKEETPVESFSFRDGDRTEKKINKKLILVLVVFLLGIAAGGFFVYKKGFLSFNKTASPKTTVSENESLITPTPTELPIDLSKYTIGVLNGSETKGAARKLKDTLSQEGFNVLSAGNATNSSFVKTVISTKKEVDKEYLKKLEDFLSESHALSTNQDLKSSAKTDVVIIIGTE